VLSALGGIAYAINGMTQAQGYAVVAVTAKSGVTFSVPSGGTVRLEGDNDALRLDAPGKAKSSWLDVPAEGLRLRAWDSTVTEQGLNRAGAAVLGLCLGIGALWLRRLLLCVAVGEPFARGNARRIAGIAGLVGVASVAVDVFPVLASELVISRVGWDKLVAAELQLSFAPLCAIPLLLVLAQAFSRGTELADDTEGLV
jgi:hypothetical protein